MSRRLTSLQAIYQRAAVLLEKQVIAITLEGSPVLELHRERVQSALIAIHALEEARGQITEESKNG